MIEFKNVVYTQKYIIRVEEYPINNVRTYLDK